MHLYVWCHTLYFIHMYDMMHSYVWCHTLYFIYMYDMMHLYVWCHTLHFIHMYDMIRMMHSYVWHDTPWFIGIYVIIHGIHCDVTHYISFICIWLKCCIHMYDIPSVLQYVQRDLATHCNNTLQQHTATHYNTLWRTWKALLRHGKYTCPSSWLRLYES